MTDPAIHDIFIIGGGINGCGIARDAAGRGYSVILAEMDDLASGTSSAATKLIHGGLRYLEHYEFRLVREALMERGVLWAIAPHLIRPLRIVLPHHKGLRPAWFLRLGLFVYDTLGGRRQLPPTHTLDLRTDAAGDPLQSRFSTAFEFSDCWADDARLVVLNARDAADRGATIRTRTKVVAARHDGEAWQVTLQAAGTPERSIVSARLLVNAAGPWVDRVLNEALGERASNVRLVKGSHIVVRRLYEHDRSYMFQNADGRVIFAIPYEVDYTLIGTTDQDYRGDPALTKISRSEIDYLCAGVSQYFRKPVLPEDVVWSYSGVRPLYDDGAGKAQEATRDYVLKSSNTPPMINVIGGKLTTYRRLAESTLERIGDLIGTKGQPWTAATPLPGGDFAPTAFQRIVDGLERDYPFLGTALADRLVRLYGTRAREILGKAIGPEDLGQHFGDGLYAAEIRYLMANEWAMTLDDILWRRTKRGLRLASVDTEAMGEFMRSVARNGPGGLPRTTHSQV